MLNISRGCQWKDGGGGVRGFLPVSSILLSDRDRSRILQHCQNRGWNITILQKIFLENVDLPEDSLVCVVVVYPRCYLAIHPKQFRVSEAFNPKSSCIIFSWERIFQKSLSQLQYYIYFKLMKREIFHTTIVSLLLWCRSGRRDKVKLFTFWKYKRDSME